MCIICELKSSTRYCGVCQSWMDDNFMAMYNRVSVMATKESRKLKWMEYFYYQAKDFDERFGYKTGEGLHPLTLVDWGIVESICPSIRNRS